MAEGVSGGCTVEEVGGASMVKGVSGGCTVEKVGGASMAEGVKFGHWIEGWATENSVSKCSGHSRIYFWVASISLTLRANS